MFRKITVFFAVLLLIQFAAAQNASFNIDIQKAGKSDSEIVLTFIPGNSLQNGFAIQLPGKMKTALVSVRVDGRLLWLKQSAEKPAAADVLHWQKKDTEYFLLLSAENLAAGKRLEIRLQSPLKKDPDNNRRITLSGIRLQADGSAAAASEIAGKAIPKLQDN